MENPLFPIFSIKYTYPKKANPVDIEPSHVADNNALVDGICAGRFSNVKGIIIKQLKIIDQPMRTILSVFSEYF